MPASLCFLDDDRAMLADRVVLRLVEWSPELGRGDGYELRGLQDVEPVHVKADIDVKAKGDGGAGGCADFDFLDDLIKTS